MESHLHGGRRYRYSVLNGVLCWTVISSALSGLGMDGSVTPRAEMTGNVARWANAQKELWQSRPVRGDIGIVFVPESEIFNFMQQGSTRHYAESARGAYQAFFDSNIQADFVHVDHLSEYPVVYLPYPIHLKEATAAKLVKDVRDGGTLISEGQARLHNGAGGDYWWLINPGREASKFSVTIDPSRIKAIQSAVELWQKDIPAPKASGTTVEIAVADRNVSVLRLVH